MTITQHLKKHLEDSGLWGDEAGAVIAQLKAARTDAANPTKNPTKNPSSDMAPMVGRWDEQTTNYPEPLIAVLVVSANIEAARWLAKNKPEHWARAMFPNL